MEHMKILSLSWTVWNLNLNLNWREGVLLGAGRVRRGKGYQVRWCHWSAMECSYLSISIKNKVTKLVLMGLVQWLTHRTTQGKGVQEGSDSQLWEARNWNLYKKWEIGCCTQNCEWSEKHGEIYDREMRQKIRQRRIIQNICIYCIY